MKLWKKISLVLVGTLCFSLTLNGVLILKDQKEDNIAMIAESCHSQMEGMISAFKTVEIPVQVKNMGEAAKNAYLKFQFQRCFGNGFALIGEDQIIVNLTGYQILNASALKQKDVVQEIDGKVLFIYGSPLEFYGEYQVLGFQEITPLYERMRSQGLRILKIGIVLAAISALFSMVAFKRFLIRLEELNQAAKRFGSGDQSARTIPCGNDEIETAERTFNQMADQVEKQVDDLEMLLAALSHEIRTPMTSIVGYADSLLRVNLTEEQKRQAAAYILREGKRLESLAFKMTSLLSIHDGEEMEFQWVSIKQFVKAIEDQWTLYLRSKNMEMEVHCPENMHVYMERTLMESLVGNLIQNSSKASLPGMKVVISAGRFGICVEDSGTGIPTQNLSKVFKPFYMGDKARSRKEGGCGLGLALCDRIARLHKAELIIESSPGCKTAVTVKFPEDFVKFTS